MISTKISNGLGRNIHAEVTEKNALKVATYDFYEYETLGRFFRNDTYGINMAVNASPTGTPERIHNGTDDDYWIGSAITGVWIFDSTDQAYSGSKSVDGTQTSHNSQCQFYRSTNPVSIFDLTNSTSISGWIYLETWPITGVKELNFIGWNILTGAVGTVVNLGNYINTGIFNEWQKFTITLEDMSLVGQSIDSVRLQNISSGPGSPIDFYIDALQIDSAIGSISPRDYLLSAPAGYIMYVDALSGVVVDAHDPTLADSTMPKLSYDKILGNAFEIGMLYRRIQNGVVVAARPIRSVLDLLSFTGITIKGPYSDGINTVMQMNTKFKYPMVLDSRELDAISVLIAEDFSVFKELRWFANTRTRRID